MELKTVYFDSAGPQNSAETMRIAADRARALGIRKVLVASTTGAAALAALDAFSGFELVIITHVTGLREPDNQEFPAETRRACESRGAKVLTVTHAFGGLSSAVRKKFNTVAVGDLIASTLRIFGHGMKVCVEIVLMAADCGVVRTDEQVIAVAGFNNGADTAIVCKPVNAQRFFDLKVQEILCKPYFG